MVAALAGGVLWSNALAYHDVPLRPACATGRAAAHRRARRRQGADVRQRVRSLRRPALPARRRPGRAGRVPHRWRWRCATASALTKSAWADIDSFPLSTIEPYRSIVTPRSPAESRPPSIYRLVWQGSYYQLWQRPAHPTTSILEHIPLGRIERAALLRRGGGRSERAAVLGRPRGDPSCALVRGLGRPGAGEHATTARLPARRADRRPRRSDPVARRLGPRSPSAHAHPQDPGRGGHPYRARRLAALRTVARRELRPRLRGQRRRPPGGHGQGRAVGVRGIRPRRRPACCTPASTRSRSPTRTPTSPPAAPTTNSPR